MRIGQFIKSKGESLSFEFFPPRDKTAEDQLFENIAELEALNPYDPEERGECIPVSQWLSKMGKTKHLSKAEYATTLQASEMEIERRWRRLKATHEHPLL